MNKSGRDMTLADALSDPLIRTVMAADGVDPRELAAILHTIAGKLERSSSHITAGGTAPERDHFIPGPKFANKDDARTSREHMQRASVVTSLNPGPPPAGPCRTRRPKPRPAAPAFGARPRLSCSWEK
jgi:hypothetical protein